MSMMLAKISKKYFFEFFIIFILLFITPAQIETSTLDYAPSLFTFIFNILFEQDFSTRVLRPLFLSLPLGIFSLFLYFFLKRKFF
tara:strand:- start:939 stop:1193 length:255 start_codon:yes stop_codon:yes gene_type:complete